LAFGRRHVVFKRRQLRGNARFQLDHRKVRFAPCVRRRGRASRDEIGNRRHQTRDEDQERTARGFDVSALGTRQCRRHEILRFGQAPDSAAPSRVLRRLVPRDGVDKEPIEIRALELEPADARFRTFSVGTQRGDARWVRAACRPHQDRSGAPKKFRTTACPAERTAARPRGKLGLPWIIYRVGGDQKSRHINARLAEVYWGAPAH
jgi:hypothetical protein